MMQIIYLIHEYYFIMWIKNKLLINYYSIIFLINNIFIENAKKILSKIIF